MIIILKYREYSKIPMDLVIQIPKQYDDYMLGLQNQRYEICCLVIWEKISNNCVWFTNIVRVLICFHLSSVNDTGDTEKNTLLLGINLLT